MCSLITTFKSMSSFITTFNVSRLNLWQLIFVFLVMQSTATGHLYNLEQDVTGCFTRHITITILNLWNKLISYQEKRIKYSRYIYIYNLHINQKEGKYLYVCMDYTVCL